MYFIREALSVDARGKRLPLMLWNQRSTPGHWQGPRGLFRPTKCTTRSSLSAHFTSCYPGGYAVDVYPDVVLTWSQGFISFESALKQVAEMASTVPHNFVQQRMLLGLDSEAAISTRSLNLSVSSCENMFLQARSLCKVAQIVQNERKK